jgi:hypothetical protein
LEKEKGGGRLGRLGPKGEEGARLGRQAAHGGEGKGGRLGRKWGRRGERRRKRFSFSKIYFPLDECFHIFKQSKKVCMVRHGASPKIKYFKVLLYTRSKAKTRCNFGKDQGLARGKGKRKG